MKKINLIWGLIFLVTLTLFGESSITTGSATRGSDDLFSSVSNGENQLLGISQARPEGTVIQVKNQKNGLTANITIVNGRSKPGIVILLNSKASDSLGIISGEVIMVNFWDKTANSNPFYSYNQDPESFKDSLNEEFLPPSGDDPASPQLDVDGEMEKLGYTEGTDLAILPEEVFLDEPILEPVVVEPVVEPIEEPIPVSPPIIEPEPSVILPPVIDDREYEEVIIAKADEGFDDVLVIESKDVEVIEEPEITPVVEVVAPIVEIPEEREAEINPNRVIYFLTPADLRPPELVEEVEPALIEESTTPSEEEIIIVFDPLVEPLVEPLDESITFEDSASLIDGDTLFVPQYVEEGELTDYMNEYVEKGSRYIQVASFSKENDKQLYSNMSQLQDSFPYLPLIVLPSENEQYLRLFVGPVSRDEVGILIHAMKAHGFSDAFMMKK